MNLKNQYLFFYLCFLSVAIIAKEPFKLCTFNGPVPGGQESLRRQMKTHREARRAREEAALPASALFLTSYLFDSDPLHFRTMQMENIADPEGPRREKSPKKDGKRCLPTNSSTPRQ